MPDELADQVAGVGALVEPARRALYRYVVSQPDPVSREQAATAVGLPLHSAKFHLDRLVEEGLLEVEFRRLSGRTGPGAGRPSKLYRRSARQFSVSLPERRYHLAGDVLASAIDRSIRSSVPVDEAVREAAAAEGRRLALESQGDATDDSAPTAPHTADGGDGGDGSDMDRTAAVLARHGYEPRVSEGEMCLVNCPFDRLAMEHSDLVCGMNLALIDGIIEGLGVRTVDAELAPQPGYCCVKVSRRCDGGTVSRTDSASRVIRAGPASVFVALVDAGALAQWLPPSGMSGRFERFDARPGGSYRLVLTYQEGSAGSGKATRGSDIVEARFVDVVPDVRVVQAVDFVSDDPAFAGTMTVTWELSVENGGTRVTIRADDVPTGIAPEDHAQGMASSLANLAAFVEPASGTTLSAAE